MHRVLGAGLLCTGLLCAGLLFGCAPTLQPPGPVATIPALGSQGFVTRDGLVLPVRCWQPVEGAPRAVVIALHGFNDYAKAFDAPGQYLAGQGIAVYAYDQRGFGASPHVGLWAGTERMVADVADIAAEIGRRHPGVPLHLLGDSMGGAVAMVAATGPAPPRVDSVILVAPAVWGRETMPLPHRVALFLSAHTVPWLTLTGRGLKIRASDNIEMLRALGRDPLVIKETRVDAIHGLADLMDAALAAAPRLRIPLLLLYGDKDEIIPREAVARTIDALPHDADTQRKVVFYPDGYHMLLRDLKAQVVWDDILLWIGLP
ncbi:MAG: lysophospholipase [Alphaproteobacteria bacterium]